MPASKAQQRAVSKYMKENYDEIKVRVDKGQKDIIKAHAEAQGESVNGFINRAIDHQISQDGLRGVSEIREGPLDAGVVSLHSEAYKCAVDASEATREGLHDFVVRAVVTQAKRDEAARKLGDTK